MPPAIHVENLSKRYRIGKRSDVAHGLRESLVSGAVAPFRKLFSRSGGSGSVSADPSSVRGHRPSLSGPSEEEIWALKDVSFEVQPGEVVGIIGENGAGKSTLLKILSRITEPTSGRVEIHGRVGSLLEVGTGFHPELTGRENVYLNGAILGMTKQEIDRKFDEIVHFSGVETFIDTPIKRYSSGMSVRLAFAVTAYVEPDVLIVDEVLAVGDVLFQSQCFERLRSLARSGATILLVSHNMSAIMSISKRAFHLATGRLLFEGPTDSAIAHYLKVLQHTTSSDLANVSRTGDGRVRISSFTPCDDVGRPLTHVTNGCRARFRIEYETIDPLLRLENCIASIGLRRLESLDWHVRSDFTQSHLVLVGPRGTIFCSVEDFALAEGEYRISLFLSHRDIVILDFIVDAGELHVVTGSFFPDCYPGLPSICPVLTRAHWSTQQC